MELLQNILNGLHVSLKCCKLIVRWEDELGERREVKGADRSYIFSVAICGHESKLSLSLLEWGRHHACSGSATVAQERGGGEATP